MKNEVVKGKNGVRAERLCAQIEGDFVVFLIGLRINRPWASDDAGDAENDPGAHRKPRAGLPGGGVVVRPHRRHGPVLALDGAAHGLCDEQRGRASARLAEFIRRVGTDGSVGIFHETFTIQAGGYEAVYVNMPPFGLGKASKAVPAVGRRESAQDRLRADEKPGTDPATEDH